MGKLIIANWKMNVLPSESVKFVREIEKINREQNKLYNNFYENFVVLRQAKTLEYDDYI